MLGGLLVLSLLTASVEERPGARLPLDAPFTDAVAGPVSLGETLGGRPALLVIAYARCTMLCSLVLRGAIEAARDRDTPLVVIGLDARETIDEARRKQAVLASDLGRELPYLVGPRASIDAVAEAVGFEYEWDPRTEQYAHPAVMFAITPDGRVARYLHGVQFARNTVDGALADAAAGRMLSTQAADVLSCFRFDPVSRTAGQRAQLLLRVGAATIFLALLLTVALLVRWERRRQP